MSGAEISYHSTIGKPALAFNNTVKLGRYLGCTQYVAEQIWDCILTRSTNDIIQAVETIPVSTCSLQCTSILAVHAIVRNLKNIYIYIFENFGSLFILT